MKRFARLATVFYFTLCLSPALLALTGVITTPRHVTDCKGATGAPMMVDLEDLGVANNPQFGDSDVLMVEEDVHGIWSYGLAAGTGHLEAETEGNTETYVSIQQGCAAGNGLDDQQQPNSKQVRVAPGSSDDNSSLNIQLECVDCSGEVTVKVMQRVLHLFVHNFVPHGGADGLAPEWRVETESTLIDEKVALTEYHCELDEQYNVNFGATASYEDGSGGSAEVLVIKDSLILEDDWDETDWNNLDPEGYPGVYSNELDVKKKRRVQLKATYSSIVERPLQCAQLPDTELLEFDATFRWEMSIEDFSMGEYVETTFAENEIDQSYKSKIYLWQISVTKNCDATGDLCPCTQYQSTDDADPS